MYQSERRNTQTKNDLMKASNLRTTVDDLQREISRKDAEISDLVSELRRKESELRNQEQKIQVIEKHVPSHDFGFRDNAASRASTTEE